MVSHKDQWSDFRQFDHGGNRDTIVSSHDANDSDELAQERRREERRRRKKNQRREKALPEEEGDIDLLKEASKKPKRKKKKRARPEHWVDEHIDFDAKFDEALEYDAEDERHKSEDDWYDD